MRQPKNKNILHQSVEANLDRDSVDITATLSQRDFREKPRAITGIEVKDIQDATPRRQQLVG